MSGKNMLDQMNDQRNDSKKNKYVTPHPGHTVKGNGIPTLFDSNGTSKPAIHPDALANGYGAQGYVGYSGSMGESFIEASEESIQIDIMKNNLNYCRIHSNDIFKNLELSSCEWDSSSQLIHILVGFKQDTKEDYVASDKLYPYPLDITIPFDLNPVVIYNSKKSPDAPDMSTETELADSNLNAAKWADGNDDDRLAQVLRVELGDLDDALDEFDESLLESSDPNALALVDEEGGYEWYMDQVQRSVFKRGEDTVFETDDLESAQEWWDSKEESVEVFERGDFDEYKISDEYLDEVYSRSLDEATISEAADTLPREGSRIEDKLGARCKISSYDGVGKERVANIVVLDEDGIVMPNGDEYSVGDTIKLSAYKLKKYLTDKTFRLV